MNLTIETDVMRYMSESASVEDWNARCEEVKRVNNGYPSFWFPAILMSGIAAETEKHWNE